MLALNELSTSELEYLHAIWSAEILTTQRNIKKRVVRLRKRTEICRQESALKRAVQQRLDDARSVLQALIDTAVNPEIIQKQHEIVRDHEAAVEEVAMIGQRTDARDLQKELLELTKLETSVEVLKAKVRELEALLAPAPEGSQQAEETSDIHPKSSRQVSALYKSDLKETLGTGKRKRSQPALPDRSRQQSRDEPAMVRGQRQRHVVNRER